MITYTYITRCIIVHLDLKRVGIIKCVDESDSLCYAYYPDAGKDGDHGDVYGTIKEVMQSLEG